MSPDFLPTMDGMGIDEIVPERLCFTKFKSLHQSPALLYLAALKICLVIL